MIRLLALGIAIVFGCSIKPSTWQGIPEDPSCGTWEGRQVTCIAGGQAYLCVDGEINGCRRDVQCAPVSMYQGEVPGRN